MKKSVAALAVVAAMTLGSGAAYATEPGYAECGDVIDGFPVGDNADMCDNPPLPAPDTSLPIPEIPPLVIDPSTGQQPVEPTPAPVAPAPALEEDESGWDCEVHGNGVCGTVTPAPVIVPQYIPAPIQMPVGTEQRVAAGQELAYTGPADTAAILAVSTFIIAGGAGLVLLSRRTKEGIQ